MTTISAWAQFLQAGIKLVLMNRQDSFKINISAWHVCFSSSLQLLLEHDCYVLVSSTKMQTACMFLVILKCLLNLSVKYAGIVYSKQSKTRLTFLKQHVHINKELTALKKISLPSASLEILFVLTPKRAKEATAKLYNTGPLRE